MEYDDTSLVPTLRAYLALGILCACMASSGAAKRLAGTTEETQGEMACFVTNFELPGTYRLWKSLAVDHHSPKQLTSPDALSTGMHLSARYVGRLTAVTLATSDVCQDGMQRAAVHVC